MKLALVSTYIFFPILAESCCYCLADWLFLVANAQRMKEAEKEGKERERGKKCACKERKEKKRKEKKF